MSFLYLKTQQLLIMQSLIFHLRVLNEIRFATHGGSLLVLNMHSIVDNTRNSISDGVLYTRCCGGWVLYTNRQHKPESALTRVMACCMTAPSHYLNQCRCLVSVVWCYLRESNLAARPLRLLFCTLGLKVIL